MDVNKYGCPFCNEFNGKEFLSYFSNTFGLKHGIDKRNVLETPDFVCVPSIGSFVTGYLLIVPRNHYLSTLSMPYQHIEQTISIIEFLKKFYLECYGSECIVFEHGSSCSNNFGGMSVVHAHLHIIPCKYKIISSVNDFTFNKYSNFRDLQIDYLEKSSQAPYLLLRDIDNCIYYCEDNHIPSQYFRKKICNCFGLIGMGDWKQYPFIDHIQKTISTANNYKLQEKYNRFVGDLYG